MTRAVVSASVIALLGAALGPGCSEPLTEVVVVTDTDLDPAEIDHVRFDVAAPEESGSVSPVTLRLVRGVPASLGIVYRGGPLGPVTATATGRLDDADLDLSRTARFDFVEGQVRVLRLDLFAACVGRDCGPESCGPAGECLPLDAPLEPWHGTIDPLEPGDGDADADVDVDADTDTDAAADADADADPDADADDDGEAQCVPPDCDDGVPCTIDRCTAGLCEHVPDDAPCDVADGESCVPTVGCAHEIWVNPDCIDSCDGSDEAHGHLTIVDGLGHAESDDEPTVVRVLPGTYDEQAYEHGDGTKPLVILGADAATTTWSTKANGALKVTSSARVEIRDVTITGAQRAIDLDSNDGAEVKLRRVTITGCANEGIKAHGTKSKLFADQCWITQNGGVGLKLEDAAEVWVRNSLLTKNGSGAITIRSDANELTVTNCTIADNVAATPAGIRREAAGTMTLSNLIVWNNSPNDPTQCQDCPRQGDLLIDVDPRFITPAERVVAADYKLAADSPALDAGVAADDITVDYWGQARDDGRLDLGADELDR